MEMDHRKLFVGGISWQTNEDGLLEYFSKYGEVMEAVIVKDCNTGRARGFGFIVFADSAVAERVVMEKHTIDGRMVEAKRAVPRDDQRMITKNNGSVPGSPVPGRTKKIFVGGLPSTLMESDFKKYFDQFGIITDAVLMYDHNIQRPRGFGFITFDSEDAVDRALVKTFHELNGKIVEVKRAVPKELSHGPTIRLPINGYNYGMNRANNFVNGYIQGYKQRMIDDYGMQMDGRIGPLANGKNGFSSVVPGFGMETDYKQTMNSNFAGDSIYTNHPSYGQTLNPYYDGNSIGHCSSTTYGGRNENSSSIFSSIDGNAWVDFMLNNANKSATSNASRASESGIVGSGSGSLKWDSSFSSELGGTGSGYNSGNPGYQGRDYIVFGSRTTERKISPTFPDANLTTNWGYHGSYTKLFDNTSVYGDPTWQLSLSELVSTAPFSYKLVKSEPDTADEGFADYMACYKMKNKQPNQGIAT
ncbi:heterogeneous nuclear ribonucleoprotein 1-like isoform X1 [Zingiber officinale]|nr:heterogeneous nuclear ribonucleoprotein 1-like isoform X1 [Zingiber officinale]XP_042424075.1 heterogeneous nuclear ribonucleoprotein 1-like isoform X1 [Zingiber officinale]